MWCGSTCTPGPSQRNQVRATSLKSSREALSVSSSADLGESPGECPSLKSLQGLQQWVGFLGNILEASSGECLGEQPHSRTGEKARGGSRRPHGPSHSLGTQSWALTPLLGAVEAWEGPVGVAVLCPGPKHHWTKQAQGQTAVPWAPTSLPHCNLLALPSQPPQRWQGGREAGLQGTVQPSSPEPARPPVGTEEGTL